MRRRTLLATLIGALAASGCVPAAPRRVPVPVVEAPWPERDAFVAEARSILLDALQALRTFDETIAFRTRVLPNDVPLSQWELPWDPPTQAAWQAAAEVARSLSERSDALNAAVVRSFPDPSRWRDRRALAAATHELTLLGPAMAEMKDAIERINPNGNGAIAIAPWQKATDQWVKAAAAFGLRRDESLVCA